MKKISNNNGSLSDFINREASKELFSVLLVFAGNLILFLGITIYYIFS